MIDTRVSPGNDVALDTWLGIEPDVYLDARSPDWAVWDVTGLVRYSRRTGDRRERIWIAPTATEIIAALAAPAGGGPRPARVT
jgi:hypothetical protein